MGEFDFQPGYYLYVGSALNGLERRITRHIRGGRFHWHIDYLLAEAELEEVWSFESDKKLECKVAETLAKHLPAPFPSFGSSDCSCISHLFYTPSPPSRIGELFDSAISCRIKVYRF